MSTINCGVLINHVNTWVFFLTCDVGSTIGDFFSAHVTHWNGSPVAKFECIWMNEGKPLREVEPVKPSFPWSLKLWLRGSHSLCFSLEDLEGFQCWHDHLAPQFTIVKNANLWKGQNEGCVQRDYKHLDLGCLRFPFLSFIIAYILAPIPWDTAVLLINSSSYTEIN